MNTRRSHLGSFLPTRSRSFGSVADLPWDQLIQAGTVVATTAIEKGGGAWKRKRKKKAEQEEVATPVPSTPSPAPIPWGPILLVGGVLGGAIILSGGRKKP